MKTMLNYRLYFIFLFASLGVSIGLQMVLPFPYGLITAIGLFITFPFIARKIAVGRMGAGRFGGLEMAKFEKVCMVCHKKGKGRQCTRCGSSQFRMG